MSDTERCNIHEARIDVLESKLTAIDSKLDALCEAVGRAPDAALGTPGSGLAKTLVEQGQKAERLARAIATDANAKIRVVKIIATSIAGAITTIAGAYIAYLTAVGG